MNNFIGFTIGVLIVDTIFQLIKIIWYMFLNIGILFWEGSKVFFNLSKRIGTKLYSSFKNKKSKTKS